MPIFSNQPDILHSLFENVFRVTVTVSAAKRLLQIVFRKISTHVHLLSILHREENVKTFRWDHRLPRQNIFMAFKRVPQW